MGRQTAKSCLFKVAIRGDIEKSIIDTRGVPGDADWQIKPR